MRLAANTVLTHPESGLPVVLREGETVPEWAIGLLGDHLVAEEPEQTKPATRAKK